MTWTDFWYNPLNRTFNCTDADTAQTLTFFTAPLDNQSNFYNAGQTVDLTPWVATGAGNLEDIAYDTSFWYVLDNDNDQVLKFNVSDGGTWNNIINYSLDALNADPKAFYRDGYFWYVVDLGDEETYQYDANWNYTGAHWNTGMI